MRGRKTLKFGLIAVAALLAVVVAGFLAWTRLAGYSAFPEAAALAETAETPEGWYAFTPAQSTDTGFIFYPGGLVDAAAYAPLLLRVSERGLLAVIVPMPLDLAILAPGRAADVIAAYPDVDHWIIGGHSLGGSMAAEFVADNPGAVDGVVFLASYPGSSTDLSALPLVAASVYGTEDGVSGDDPLASLPRLPAETRLVVIEGGNHAQFGDYGPQRGDGTATIGRDEQQRQAAAAIAAAADGLR